MLRTAQLLPLTRAFDTALRRRTFPPDAGSLLPGPLAATRTGLTPAGNDELPTESDHVITPPLPNCRAYSRSAWIFGDDSRRTLGGGTDRVGLFGGFGVGVSVQSPDELRHLFVALDAAEGSFGVEHAGRCPAQHHLSVAPTGDVAVGGPRDGDHRLDRVRRGQRLGQAAVDAEPGDGEHLLKPFAQRGGRTRVALIQL